MDSSLCFSIVIDGGAYDNEVAPSGGPYIDIIYQDIPVLRDNRNAQQLWVDMQHPLRVTFCCLHPLRSIGSRDMRDQRTRKSDALDKPVARNDMYFSRVHHWSAA
jgi:hypothetical protein